MNLFPDLPHEEFLRTRLVLLAALALAVLGWMSWDAYTGLLPDEKQPALTERMQRLGTQMLELEGIMSMSARMAATSGDPKWERQYRNAEPQLDRLIAEASRLQPTAPAGTAIARLSAANAALVPAQRTAFDLIRQGHQSEALQLLSGELQEARRARYAQGLAEFAASQAHTTRTIADGVLIRSRRDHAYRTFTATALLILLLSVGLFVVFRAIRRWQTFLVDNNRELKNKAIELGEFNDRLDQKVSERTRDLTDSALASLNMMEDAVRQREQTELAQERLNYLAYYDQLTGLANETLFLQRVQAKMKSTSGDQVLVIILNDIVRFKSINDAFGRHAGDDLLKQVAERLVSIGGGDAERFARIGADRFAGVATSLRNADNAGRYASERVDEIFHPPFRIANTDVQVSVKIGIAVYPADGADAYTLLRNAEAALKKAKGSGELFLYFNQAMTERVAERLSLEHRLRQAVDSKQFVLHYQPKVNLLSGRLTGAEALIRWNDPTAGLVEPGIFIPILEETQLIQEVGRWAMSKAVEDYLHWCNLGMDAVPIAVNVSALQLRNRGFIDDVRQIVAIDVRAAQGLELEITESMVMDDIEQAIVTLRELRAMGVKIAIDDFGTGFSSLTYLSKLPIDTLKVDRAFITDMTNGPQGIALVKAIITLAHSLQLTVVAEGVETQEQVRLLTAMRCDEMQGFLLSKAIAGELFQSRYLSMHVDE